MNGLPIWIRKRNKPEIFSIILANACFGREDSPCNIFPFTLERAGVFLIRPFPSVDTCFSFGEIG